MQPDLRISSFESGKFLDTVGLLTCDMPADENMRKCFYVPAWYDIYSYDMLTHACTHFLVHQCLCEIFAIHLLY